MTYHHIGLIYVQNLPQLSYGNTYQIFLQGKRRTLVYTREFDALLRALFEPDLKEGYITLGRVRYLLHITFCHFLYMIIS